MIEKLTKSQQAKLPKYVKRWTVIGLKTGLANRTKAEKAIKEIYAISKLDEPKHFIWVQSPLGAELAHLLIKEVSKHTKEYDPASVWDSVGASVWASVWDSVRASVGGGITASFHYGQHDANWIGFYEFFDKELKIKGAEKIRPMISLAEEIGWWAPYKDFVIVSERPTEIHIGERGRLHNFTGPCLKYGDGFEMYRFNGVVVPAEYATKDTFTKEDILGEKNVDVRRELVKKIGIKKAIETLNAKTIDTYQDKFGSDYRLLELDLGDKSGRPYLQMHLKTKQGPQTYIEGVRPGTKTVKDAICYRNGIATFEEPQALT